MEINKILDLQEKVNALANGVNPFTGETSADSLDLNDPQTIRFLFNLSDVLKDFTKRRATKKENAFVFTQGLEEKVLIEDNDITLSNFLRRVGEANDGIAPKYKPVAAILVDEGFLENAVVGADRYSKKKHPTQKAQEYGIVEKAVASGYRIYQAIFYGRKGQELVLSLLKKYFSKENQNEET